MSSRKNRIILLSSIAGMAVMVVVIVITVVHVMTKDDHSKVATKDVFTSHPTADQLETLYKIQQKNPPKAYLMTFKLSSNGTPTKLESIKQYRRSADKLNPPMGQYLISIKDSNGISYSTSFSVTAITNEPTQDGVAQAAPTITTPTSYSVFVPWMPNKSSYTVKDLSGKTLLKGAIDKVQIRDR